MKRFLRFAAFAALGCGVLRGGIHAVDPFVQGRIGYDTNPVASGGTTTAAWGDDAALTCGAGAGVTFTNAPATAEAPVIKAGYTAELVRFDGAAGEDFATHKFSLSARARAGAWKLTGDAGTVLIAGSRDTLLSVANANANATALWRERRRQWQHRLKAQAQGDFGATVVRATASLLAYDYQTRVVPGYVAFADRSDVQAGLDAGWQQSPRSLFLAGLREGAQHQDMVPLPNCAYEYNNTYTRLALGWEGQLGGNTTVALMAGPDFRHYSGQIDPVAFLGGRNRTSLWFEGSLAAKPTKDLTLTAKAARMDWLSSTGKSAYLDTSVELGAALKLSPAWTVRANTKVHRCDYFPVVRDDWEALVGGGLTWAASDRLALTLDVLRHRGWNRLDWIGGREFHRTTAAVGASLKL